MSANMHSRADCIMSMDWLRRVGWLALFPLLAVQAMSSRLFTPRLPDAAGPDEGRLSGRGPALRLLAVGESTVTGAGVASLDQALTCQCARRLHNMTGRAVRWKALGRNGADARRLLELVRHAPRLEADIVLLALGVNDTMALRPADKWARDLAALVKGVRERVGQAPVLLAGVPPMGGFTALPQPLRSFLGERAGQLDLQARLLAARMPGLAHCPTPLPLSDYLAQDGFHPSQAGYSGWSWVLSMELAALGCLGQDEVVADLAAVAYDPLRLGTRRAA